ncbi:MAG: GNAT family N-acetyltransferase [Oscillospiraceae bacterium]|nr:GNAT family N-acetyltransferase [Oscillospiraceae bacterium]
MFGKVLSFLSFLKKPRLAAGDKTADETDFKYLTKDKKNKRLKEIFSHIPNLETQRLVLRRIEEGDCADMFEYSADLDVTKYLTWQPHAHIGETKRHMAEIQKRYDNGQFYDWGMVYKENGSLVGTCGFTSVDTGKNACEVGYVLSKKYWGKGLVPEALERIMEFAFDYIGFETIEARFLDGNAQSKKVMEKVGMVYAKTEHKALFVRDGFKTVYTYSITKEAFEIRK